MVTLGLPTPHGSLVGVTQSLLHRLKGWGSEQWVWPIYPGTKRVDQTLPLHSSTFLQPEPGHPGSDAR